MDSNVNAIFALSSNEIYVGGTFTNAGCHTVNNITKWNGSVWTIMDNGINGTINAIYAVSSKEVYVGGLFTTASGVVSNNIVMWDGIQWASLNFGVNGVVNTIFALHSKLVYVGGSFVVNNCTNIINIAKWNGSYWSALGNININGYINTIHAISDNDIYIGGSFNIMLSGGNIINNIAKWNGSNWYPIGNNIDGEISILYALSTSDIYIGGSFDEFNNIARWNGTNWLSLENGINGQVYTIFALSSSEIYIGGSFNKNIMIWNNQIQKWSDLYVGTSNSVSAIFALSPTQVYVGGSFINAGSLIVNNIARWNGILWSALQYTVGTDNTVFAICPISENEIYVGGYFTSAGEISANNIAKFDGMQWSVVGDGIDGIVYTIDAISSNDIYIGGSFTSSNNTTLNNIAKWNGSNIVALQYNGTVGICGVIKTINVLFADNVYIGGSFYTVGDIICNNIVRWDGTSWHSLSTGIIGQVNTIHALSTTEVYVGGSFNVAGDIQANNVAIWNGTSWVAMIYIGYEGLSNFVNVIYALSSNNIYIGGSFCVAGDITVNNVVRWDGYRWHTLGIQNKFGTNGSVYAIYALSNDEVYIGGSFTIAGNITANNIVKYSKFQHNNCITWTSLDSGVNSDVYAIAYIQNKLYVGGNFMTSSGLLANNIAMWDKTKWNALPCFLRGTLIKTSDGYVQIENLIVDTELCTLNGSTKIKNIYKKNIFNERELYCFPKNFFEIGMPFQDLYITGGHAIWLQNKQIWAHPSCRYSSLIAENYKNKDIEIYHIETSDFNNDKIYANEILTETYGDFDHYWECEGHGLSDICNLVY